MKKALLLFMSATLLAGCGEPSYKYSKDIVGTWALQSMEYQEETYPIGDAENGFPGEFTFSFKDDGTYTATSSIGSIEENDFDNSIPFRASGEYKGYYLVDAPAGMKIREEYRGPSFLSGLSISGSTLICEYMPDNSEDWVKLTFTKK